jgi:hypothetical protein
MNRRVGWCLLTMLGAASVACGDPDQLYRHRDAGAGPAGAAGGGGHGGALAGGGGSTTSGAAGNATGPGAGGSLGGTSGGGGSTSTAGSTGTGGFTSGGGAGGSTGTSGAGGSTSGGGAGGSTGTGGAANTGGASGNGGNGGASGSGGAAGGTTGTGGVTADGGMPACTSTPDCHCDYYGGHAYKFCGNGRGYADAATACAMQGMRLIRIDDEGENQWAFAGKGMRGFPGVWIGADDMAVEGDWRWSDGTAFWMGKAGTAGAGPVGGLFNAWQTSPAQPDDQNGNEDCAGYDYGTDRWADLPCTNHNAYICELY